ncbi:MAG: GreA/GreB family elongation factor [Thermoanaerobaculia bacterium]
MAISRRTQDLLAKGDFDAVEGDWFSQLEEGPEELDYFVGVARALVGHAADQRARGLLEMLYDHLGSLPAFRSRLTLLRRAGDILHSDPEQLHTSILGNLEQLYGGGPSFRGLLENVGLLRAAHDIPKTWEKVERLEQLVAFELGEVVFMEGKGAGRVVEVNLQLQSFRVEIPGQPRMAVGFRAAPKLLKRIARDHFLHRKLNQPETLAVLARENPSEVLRILLSSYPQPLTAAEVKRDLSGLVTEAGWTSWWAAARKHPQVVATTGSRQTYTWAATNEAALSNVWTAFAKAEPRKKLELFRRDGSRDADLKARMAEDLAALAASAVATNPGLAVEIWFALDREGIAPQDEDWSAPVLLSERPDPKAVLAGVEDRALRERGYQLLPELRSDWLEQYSSALLKEEEARTLEFLAAALVREDPAGFDRIFDTAVAQPAKNPAAFTWLAERAGREESLRRRSPLRLLQQILVALNLNELAPYRVRLLSLFDSGNTVPRILPLLSEDEAARASEAVAKAAGLESYRRDDLQRALELRFSSLRAPEVIPLYSLPGTLEAKQQELRAIVEKDIPANRKAIEEARAMGDLRENFEYKSARQRHEYLTARAGELNGQLTRARALDLATIEPDEARIGTTLRLSDGRDLSILGPWESNPEGGVISYESELGKLLLGKKAGETVEISGTPLTVEGIRVYGS